tara:strand:- start:8 stop:499 length:492 start_codon:yes stop_codon:yes gene_type:complete
LAHKLNTAIYPGSFDPITNGHIDIINRSASLFDKVIISISKESMSKNYLFDDLERLNLVKENINHLNNIEVTIFDELLVNYAKKMNANIIIRGLRAFSDFESEFQMSLMNRKMNASINTLFLMPHEKYTHISSSIVKEVSLLGGNVSDYVPESVLLALSHKNE